MLDRDRLAEEFGAALPGAERTLREPLDERALL